MALSSPPHFPKNFEHRHRIRVNLPIKRHRSFILENIPAAAGVVITIFYTIETTITEIRILIQTKILKTLWKQYEYINSNT